MEVSLLTEIVIIFGLTVVILFVCNRLNIPSIVGFLLSGMLAGPYGFRLIALDKDVDTFAEIGVVLLLFTIGIEFSLASIMQIRRFVFMGGSLQVLLTIAVTVVVMKIAGLNLGQAVFVGFLVSLSSTAIVLKLFQQRDEISTPHGKLALAILIFQDIIVVPMMLLTPLLTGGSTDIGESLFFMLLKACGIVLLTIVSARWIIPTILFQIMRMRSNEIFILTLIVLCFAVAWLTSSLGLSLSLGAFLAGLIISESEYSHQAFSTIMPFRDVFTSFFFISIGMLFDVRFLLDEPVLIFSALLGVLLLKSLLAGVSSFLMGFPIRTVILVAFALAQVGEFSFVLSKTGVESGLISQHHYQLFLAVSILTMAASPFMIRFSYSLSGMAERMGLPRWLLQGIRRESRVSTSEQEQLEKLNNHLIIIGYGVIGKNVARAARLTNIQHVVIEMNAETVKQERKKNLPVYYGDATQSGILDHVNIENAKAVVVAIPDPVATRAIVSLARRMNPDANIIVRTRYVKEMKPLFDLGANEVIPEEFETSVEMFTIVLMKYLIPRNVVEQVVQKIRDDSYQILRNVNLPTLTISDLQQHFTGIDISTFSLLDSSSLAGKTLIEAELRQRYSVSLLAVIRGKEVITNPDSDTVLNVNDRIIVFGTPEEIMAFSAVVNSGGIKKLKD